MSNPVQDADFHLRKALAALYAHIVFLTQHPEAGGATLRAQSTALAVARSHAATVLGIIKVLNTL